MKRFYRIYFAMAALVCAVSCTRFEEMPVPGPEKPEPVPGREVTAYLPLNVVALECTEEDWVDFGAGKKATPATRVPSNITVDENAIDDVWVFQFGEPTTAGDDDTRELVCPPFYVDPDTIDDIYNDWVLSGTTRSPHIPIPLIESGAGEEHLVVFAANVNSKEFNWSMSSVAGQRNTYADLKKRIFLLENEEASYGGDNENLLMSGRVYSAVSPDIVLDDNPTVSTPDELDGVPMYRSLSRIQFDVSIPQNLNFKVLSVQLRNIPQRIDIFDALIARDENLFTDYSLTYPPLPATLIDYELMYDPNGLVLPGGEQSWFWYLPRNMRGQTANQSGRSKHTFAPLGATYIEVTAVDMDNNDEGIIYRIYPGVNDPGNGISETNDFTVLGNYRYMVRLDIEGGDDKLKNDSRVEQYSRVRLDGNNNCFILNPPMAGMGRRTFEIPVTQVNRYWRQMWDGYGQLGEDLLKLDTDWQVDLLWQDAAGMVRDTSNPAKTPAQIWLEKSVGTGGDDVFSVSVPSGATHGNFVIALRRKVGGVVEDIVRWSWHLWVTDYNPDDESRHIIDGHRFVYPVPGGQVERYGGPQWGNNTGSTSSNSNWNNYTYDPNAPGDYVNAFMMDRYLGSLTPEYSTDRRNIFHYNWGRKDPIPTVPAGGLYNIAGAAIATTATAGFSAQKWNANANYTSTGAQPMTWTLAQPMTILYADISDVDGSSNDNTTPELKNYLWHDPLVRTPTYSTHTYKGKSIYDPCPPGWRLPALNVWEDFRGSVTNGFTVNVYSNHGRGDGFGVWNNGFRYWPNIGNAEGERPVEGVIQYPAYGYRYSSATIQYLGSYVYVWSALPYGSSANNTSAYVFYAYNGYLYLNNTMSRQYGCVVRCATIEDNY